MFFGVQVVAGEGMQKIDVPEGYDKEWLSVELHRAVLVDGAKGKQTVLYVDHDKYEKVALASLSLENPQVSLEVPFPTAHDVRFSVEGPGTVHVCGVLNDNFDEGDEEDEEEEGDVTTGTTTTTAAASDLYAKASDSESEEEDKAFKQDESSSEPDTSDEEQPQKQQKKVRIQEAEDSSEEEEEETITTSTTKQVIPKSKVAVKRKTPSSAQSPPPSAKKEKKEDSKATPEEHKFKEAIVNYLKKNGASSIGQLGSKVPKPATLKAVKWSQFLKKFPVFKVDGQNVSLAH